MNTYVRSVAYRDNTGEWKISLGFSHLLMILSDGYFNIKCLSDGKYQLESIKSRLILDGVLSYKEYAWNFYPDKTSDTHRSGIIEDDLEINFINNVLDPSGIHNKSVGEYYLYDVLDNSEIYNSGYGYLVKYLDNETGLNYYYINPNGLLFMNKGTFDFDMNPKLSSYLEVASYERMEG